MKTTPSNYAEKLMLRDDIHDGSVDDLHERLINAAEQLRYESERETFDVDDWTTAHRHFEYREKVLVGRLQVEALK
jgi:hypothetical protein